MALDGLLRKEEPNSDFAVHQPVGDELKHFDLARGRILLELGRRRLERDDVRAVAPPLGDGVESTRVFEVAIEDRIALGYIHPRAIGGPAPAL